MITAEYLRQKKFKEIQFIQGSMTPEAHAVRSPETCTEGSLVFASNLVQLHQAISNRATIIIVHQKIAASIDPHINEIAFFSTPHIQAAMASILPFFDKSKTPWQSESAISQQAYIHPTAKIGPGVIIQAFAWIGANVILGANVKIGSGTTIQDRSVIGQNTEIHPQVFIGTDTEIGVDCEIHPHVTIAGHGFGLSTSPDFKHTKIPQVGRVLIGDRVRIGSNCAIDRATLGSTKIGSGTKIDNLCHIAHNCEVGEDSVIAAGFFVAGSSQIGAKFMTGGCSVVSDHVKIADQVMLAGRSSVTNDIQEKGAYGGYPLQPLKDSLKTISSLGHLVEMRKQLARVTKFLKIESSEERNS